MVERRMSSRSKNKLIIYLVVFATVFIGYFLIIKAFEDNIIYFITPSEIKAKRPDGKEIRIGGLVKTGSVVHNSDLDWAFTITDNDAEVLVKYHGMMPNLFRDGQGVIAQGKIQNGIFMANEVLAKHDEKYMPKAVVDNLKTKGYWRK